MSYCQRYHHCADVLLRNCSLTHSSSHCDFPVAPCISAHTVLQADARSHHPPAFTLARPHYLLVECNTEYRPWACSRSQSNSHSNCISALKLSSALCTSTRSFGTRNNKKSCKTADSDTLLSVPYTMTIRDTNDQWIGMTPVSATAWLRMRPSVCNEGISIV